MFTQFYANSRPFGVSCGVSFTPISEVGRNLFKRPFDRLIVAVGVDIQGDACVGVSHEVLQAFHIQTGLLRVGAKGVP